MKSIFQKEIKRVHSNTSKFYPHVLAWGVDKKNNKIFSRVPIEELNDYWICGQGDLAVYNSDRVSTPVSLDQLVSMSESYEPDSLKSGELLFAYPVVTGIDIAPFETVLNDGETWVKVPRGRNSLGLTVSYHTYIRLLRMNNPAVNVTGFFGDDNKADRWFLIEKLKGEELTCQQKCINTTLKYLGEKPIRKSMPVYAVLGFAAFHSEGDFVQQIIRPISKNNRRPIDFSEQCALELIIKHPSVAPGLLKRTWPFWQKYYSNDDIAVVGPVTSAVDSFVKSASQTVRLIMQ